MPEPNTGNANPENGEEIEETPEGLENTEEEEVEEPEEAGDDDSDDVRALKEKNRQLFARAKKAEGFTQDKNGNWVKPEPKPEKPKAAPASNKQETPEDPAEVARRVFQEEAERQALEQLELSDDLKQEVQDLAQLKGISVREAAQLPYIQQRKEEVEREERVRNATPQRKNKGSYVSNIDPSKPLDPADFDFNTEEGVKAWNEAKAARKRFQSQS